MVISDSDFFPLDSSMDPILKNLASGEYVNLVTFIVRKNFSGVIEATVENGDLPEEYHEVTLEELKTRT